ncbi:hypothetical protein F9L16_22810 [Agarivorans sp. B2Z047]|uniref:hypothetical protein n=1 Tax=Agarivorans sp. B2Z047 TaxID=2652721 RepID=UPI00128B07D9|nr:hypothetical protein [Agarivorans sp. B2Z047]MPW31804.1 hypothetical protein [Agarivorans sp. B2Z047]UQN43729.1 hypothetical protein LQZ07_04465 [Agarivorans sp. B2Z047]
MSDYYLKLQKSGTQIIAIDRPLNEVHFACILSEDFDAAYELTQSVLGEGVALDVESVTVLSEEIDDWPRGKVRSGLSHNLNGDGWPTVYRDVQSQILNILVLDVSTSVTTPLICSLRKPSPVVVTVWFYRPPAKLKNLARNCVCGLKKSTNNRRHTLKHKDK